MRRSIQIILTILLTVTLVGLAWYAGSRKQETPMGQLVILTCPLKSGDLIQEDDLALIELPASQIQADWLTAPEAAIGLTALADLPAGEILHRARLGQARAGLSYNAAPGRRLMTIQPDPASANGYWLSDGSVIDVYLVPRSNSEQEIQVLREIRILKVLTGADDDLHQSSVTPLLCLDLTREQALLLAQADNWYSLKIAAVSQ